MVYYLVHLFDGETSVNNGIDKVTIIPRNSSGYSYYTGKKKHGCTLICLSR